eukprot:2385028-Heterocapsa_arctica.AAC.1
MLSAAQLSLPGSGSELETEVIQRKQSAQRRGEARRAEQYFWGKVTVNKERGGNDTPKQHPLGSQPTRKNIKALIGCLLGDRKTVGDGEQH